MSKVAPWLALSVDWQDSAMFDDAPHGERLAWICLLCYVKAQGRAGVVRIRDKAFAAQFRLTTQAVDGMLARAIAGPEPAVIRQGDAITVVNWKDYQDPMARALYQARKQVGKKKHSFTKKSSTHHPSPRTSNKPPFIPPTVQEVAAYCSERKNGINPQKFVNYYETRGWLLGKNQTRMRNWKAAICTWENQNESEQKKPVLPSREDDAVWMP